MEDQTCATCQHHKPHPLRQTDDKICGVLLKDCAQITVTPDKHKCDFGSYQAKPN